MKNVCRLFRHPASFAAAITCAIAISALPSLAAEIVKEVHFKKGETSTTLSDSVKGDDAVLYKLAAEAGQAMSILFAPKHAACYFNVMAPGAKEAAHNGSISGNEYSANLTASGDYSVQVYLMRNAARRNETCKFDITIEITGAGSGKSSAASGDAERDMLMACASKAVSMYGVKQADVRFDQEGSPKATGSGFVMTGEVNKGAEGKKQFSCAFGADRKLVNLTPLNSDGE